MVDLEVAVAHYDHRKEDVEHSGIAEGVVADRMVAGKPEAHNWGDSFVQTVERVGVVAACVTADEGDRSAVDRVVVGRAEVDHAVEGHAAQDDDCLATADQDSQLEDLADQELEDLCKDLDSEDHYSRLEDLVLEVDPDEDLAHWEDHCSRSHVGKDLHREIHHVRLDCRLCPIPEEHHRPVAAADAEVAVRIRIEGFVVVGDSPTEGVPVEAEGEEGSCTADLQPWFVDTSFQEPT